MSRKLTLAGAALASAIVVCSTARADQLVVNGGFETGHPDFWSTNPAGSWDALQNNGGVTSYDGYFAYTGCNISYCTLSQTLATTAGVTYELSFAYNPGVNANAIDPNTPPGPNGADTQVFWGGALVLDIPGGNLGWAVHTLDLVAISNSTTLAFSSYQKTSNNGLDDVSVSSVPGPIAGAGLPGALFAGGGLLAWWRRRKIS